LGLSFRATISNNTGWQSWSCWRDVGGWFLEQGALLAGVMMRGISSGKWLPGQMMLVAGLSLGLGWGAARTLYSQNAEPAPAAAPQAEQAKEAAAETAEAAPVEDPLGDLAWLTGDWVEEGDNPGVEFNARWTGTGAFLVRAFRVAIDEESTLPGLQVIGWDPAAKQVRSWTFDGTGGFGEETWSRQDDTWTIRSKYTLPDGSKAGSINVLTRLDDDAFSWKSVNREMNGELQPDVDEFTVVRANAVVAAPPAPAAPVGVPAGVPVPAGTRPAAPAAVPGRPAQPVVPAQPAVPVRPGTQVLPGVPRPAVPQPVVPR
jgi:hypothetical protein